MALLQACQSQSLLLQAFHKCLAALDQMNFRAAAKAALGICDLGTSKLPLARDANRRRKIDPGAIYASTFNRMLPGTRYHTGSAMCSPYVA